MSSPAPEGTRPTEPSRASSLDAAGTTGSTRHGSVTGPLDGRSSGSGQGGSRSRGGCWRTRCVAEGMGAPESAREKHPWWQVIA